MKLIFITGKPTIMIKIFLSLIFFATLTSFALVNLKPADSDEAVIFTIKNFGINTKGELKGLKGTIKWDAAKISNSSFNVSADVNTINTGIDMRDNDLKKETYFDAKKYPAINFVSTSVAADAVTGNLTIKGVTRSIFIYYTVKPSGNGYLFEGEFSINRRDFGVGGGGMVLGENVNVKLKVQANP